MTDREKWIAIRHRDESCDGLFYYSARPDGTFCRPSCQFRPQLGDPVRFFDSVEEAVSQGLRPCPFCRPDRTESRRPVEIVEKAKKLIDDLYTEPKLLRGQMRSLPATKDYLNRLFLEEYGVTSMEYIEKLRVQLAKELLCSSPYPISVVAKRCGYYSLSPFYDSFKRHTGATAAAYRRQNRQN